MTAKLVRSTMEKSLIREALPDAECDFEVGSADRLDCGPSTADGLPVALGGLPAETMSEQQPRLDEHVVGRDEGVAARQRRFGTLVAPVAAVGSGVEDGGVDEERQRPPSTASPR